MGEGGSPLSAPHPKRKSPQLHDACAHRALPRAQQQQPRRLRHRSARGSQEEAEFRVHCRRNTILWPRHLNHPTDPKIMPRAPPLAPARATAREWC